MNELQRMEQALEEKVAKLKAEGVDPTDRASITAEERHAAGVARGDFFASVTQGKGKPSTYGHGSRERTLKETGRKK